MFRHTKIRSLAVPPVLMHEEMFAMQRKWQSEVFEVGRLGRISLTYFGFVIPEPLGRQVCCGG